jgi:hypothetical protein
MECVDGMLAGNPRIAAIAQEAYGRGMTRRQAREALGRGFLAALWYAYQEGGGDDPNKGVADWFRKELLREEQR